MSKQKINFVLESLLTKYNNAIESFVSAGQKLLEINHLLHQFAEETNQASLALAQHAQSSIHCKKLASPISDVSDSIQGILETQKHTFCEIYEVIFSSLEQKLDNDIKFLSQQIKIFNNQHDEMSNEVLDCTMKINKSKKHATPNLLQAALTHRDELHKKLSDFTKEYLEIASKEESRRYNYFYQKQLLFLEKLENVTQLAQHDMINSRKSDSKFLSAQDDDDLTSISQQINKSNDDVILPFDPPEFVTTKFSYKQTSDKEMELLAGDLIKVLVSESSSGWKYGENQRTKAKGWFPANYTMAPVNLDTDI